MLNGRWCYLVSTGSVGCVLVVMFVWQQRIVLRCVGLHEPSNNRKDTVIGPMQQSGERLAATRANRIECSSVCTVNAQIYRSRWYTQAASGQCSRYISLSTGTHGYDMQQMRRGYGRRSLSNISSRQD